MKKILSLSLVTLILFGTISTSAVAVNAQANTLEITSVVETFLQNYAEYTRINEPVELTRNTVLDASVPMVLLENQPFVLSSGDATLTDIQNNIAFLEEKAMYFKEARKMQGITRTDLSLDYDFKNITINDNSAFVEVSELASFFYTGETQQTFIEKVYNVDLINIGGQWLVADVTDNEWFDATFKEEPTFSAQTELLNLENSLLFPQSSVVEQVGGDVLTPMTVGTYQIPYNGENAAAYAYTYTRQNTGGSGWQDYYNPNFAEWKSTDSADCMNFASQCMYAGFSGDGAEEAIDAHKQPMDADGTYMWYSCTRNTDNKNNNSTASWRSCMNFRNYLTGKMDGSGTTGSNAATDIGMKGQRLSIASGAAISGTTANSLVGALGHVYSSTGDVYGHAIILTDATALTRDKIYYSAHTGDTKYAKLGDEFTGVMQIFIPQYFRTNKPSADYLKVNMLRPVSVNTTSTLKCYTTAAQYKFTITVTSPTGTQTQTSANNTNSCSYSYKFTQPGLYTVSCYSKTTSTATAEGITFRVLVY